MMSDRKPRASGDHPPPQGLRQSADPASGFVADDSAGYSSVGQSEQRSTEASSGRYTNFNHASPESNVGPAGAAQSSHGNAGGRVPGSTVDKAEGSQGQQNRQQDEVAMSGGGNPSDAAATDGGMGNRAGTDDDADKLDDESR
ncbi:hypothetical protein [Massilia sp. ST3]|uniref:hypothetical protein n=1 Tax=Massilia sp. ST3 TaxID=2824903 RepID=UPI001B819DA2|nr:hypothetical protein [Massilia sp. ST3]MBQ5948573.1 hypothetical protein [Massilia sp. ST3]